MGSKKSVLELVALWETLPEESSGRFGVSKSTSSDGETKKKLPLLSAPPPAGGSDTICRSPSSSSPNSVLLKEVPGDRISFFCSLYNLDLKELQWYSFDVPAPSPTPSCSLSRSRSRGANPLPDCLHKEQDCEKESLRLVARVSQCNMLSHGWAVLNEGRLLCRIGVPMSEYQEPVDEFDELLALDLAKGNGKWHFRAWMSFARHLPHTWAIGGKIYVIGGIFDSSLPWAEVYDPCTNKWATLPNPRIDDGYNRFAYLDMFTASSFAPLGDDGCNQLLLFVGFPSRREIYLLDVPENSWQSLGGGHILNFCPPTQIAAVGFTLFWVAPCSTLYAYDIAAKREFRGPILNTLLAPVAVVVDCTFGRIHSIFHAGGNTLCFVFWGKLNSPITQRRRRLYCFTFRVTLSKTSASMKVVAESCQSYQVQDYIVHQVELVNPELVWRDNLQPGIYADLEVFLESENGEDDEQDDDDDDADGLLAAVKIENRRERKCQNRDKRSRRR